MSGARLLVLLATISMAAAPVALAEETEQEPELAREPEVEEREPSTREYLERQTIDAMGSAYVALEKKRADQGSAESRFIGLGFGLGIGVSFDLSSGDRVEEAELDENGIVRVKKESNEVTRIALETHHFFRAKHRVDPETGEKITTLGHGPFAAIQSSDDSVLDTFAIGWMAGFRRTGQQGTSSNSFNIGIGPVIDREVQTLGSGIKENEPLPPGETQIRFKEESRLGVLLLVSFSF